MEEKYKKKQL
jgi:hypothetical protein